VKINNQLNSIRAVETMNFEIVSPGHGVVGRKPDVAEHGHYLEELRDAVRSGIEAGHGAEEMKRTIHLDKYDDWFMYDAWRAENVEGMYNLLGNGN
jgi:hypothetical protein